jgi:hypothetical protein
MVHDSVVQLYPSLIDNFRAGIGPYVEVAFFHKKSRTLLVTHAVIYVSDKPPKAVGRQSLLNAAKNGLAVRILSAGKKIPDDPIVDDESTRQRGMIVATHEKDRKLLVMAVVFG